MPRRRSTGISSSLGFALLLAAVALLAFSPALGYGFVYDDAWTIVDNAWLSHPVAELVGLLASGDAIARHVPDATRPVMVLSLWLDRKVFGLAPFGFHLVSLLLYGLTTAAATLVAFRLSRRRSVAAVAGAFFALAPLHAEPVAAVNYREDLLCALGVLGALACLFASSRAFGRPGRARRRAARNAANGDVRRAAGAGVAWGLALLAKESAVVLVPLAGVLLLVLPHLRRTGRARRAGLVALGVAGTLWALWRLPIALHGDDIPRAPERSLAQLLFRSARYEVEAVRHALLPFFWAPDRWHLPDAAPGWLVPLFAILASVFVLARRRSTRLPALALAIALVAPLGTSPLFRPANEIADRYFFLGVLGGGLFWGWALDQGVRRLGVARRRPWVAAFCLPMLVPAWGATRIWRDERSLWTAAVTRSPSSARAWAGLARAERGDGDFRAAEAAVERALAIDPDYAPALVTRVFDELAEGRIERARAHLADLERRELSGFKGVARAARCAKLDAKAASECIGR